MPVRNAVFFFALPLVAAACGGSAETSLEDAFCDLLAGAAGASVDATPELDGAPEVALPDQRVEVDLVEVEDGWYGVVAYTPDEAGSFAFGFDEDVPVTVVEAGGSPLPWKAEVTGAACDELAVRRTVELGLDTVYLQIGPSDVATVGLVAEESDDDL